MIRSKVEQEKRLAELKREVTRRGFDRHASILKDISELPGELQARTVMELVSRETIHTIIVFPPQICRGWDYVPKQALIFTPTGLIHLMGPIWTGEEPRITPLNGHGLMYMEVKLILLYGFLELVVQGQDSSTKLGMEFNTVAWSHLSSPLKQFLQLTKAATDLKTIHNHSPNIQHSLEELPLKFSNGVKIYGLLPGEQLEALVFQPGTWKRWLYVFRRPITADTLLLLSSHYVIAIREDVRVPQGWILTYIPRGCIVEIQNQSLDLYSELTVRMKRGDQRAEYTLSLTSEAVEAWRLHWIQHGGQWQDIQDQMEESDSIPES